MRTPTNKTYEYSNLNDILEFVTSENIDDFTIDFLVTLRYAVTMKELINTMDLPPEDKIVKLGVFSWIDDGKHDATVMVTAKDTDETIVLEWKAEVSQDILQERIDVLNKEQKRRDRHPLTCGRSSSNCEVFMSPRDFSKDGVLIATTSGWVCPCGEYKQPY